MVICDTYKPDGSPLKENNRAWAKALFDQKPEEEPWFGLEQEYFLMSTHTGKPLGFPAAYGALPPAQGINFQGQYYCSAGAQNAFGRAVADEHLMACITAGIKVSASCHVLVCKNSTS